MTFLRPHKLAVVKRGFTGGCLSKGATLPQPETWLMACFQQEVQLAHHNGVTSSLNNHGSIQTQAFWVLRH